MNLGTALLTMARDQLLEHLDTFATSLDTALVTQPLKRREPLQFVTGSSLELSRFCLGGVKPRFRRRHTMSQRKTYSTESEWDSVPLRLTIF